MAQKSVAENINKANVGSEFSNIYLIDAWKKDKAKDKEGVARLLEQEFGIIEGDTTESIEVKVAKTQCSPGIIKLSDLTDPVKAMNMQAGIQKIINDVKSMYNWVYSHTTDDSGRKLYTKVTITTTSFSHTIPLYFLISTGDVRLLRKAKGPNGNSVISENTYILREYEDGKPTGLWKIFKLTKDGLGPLADIIDNLTAGCKTNHRNDVIATLLSGLPGKVKHGTDTFKEYDYKIIPCRNGLVDGRENKIRFVPWEDQDTLEKEYEDICPTWKLRVDYDPEAPCPEYFDPIQFFNNLFEDKDKELREVSVKILKQTFQFAIRGTCGGGTDEDGWMVWFCNMYGRAEGSNGKSTTTALLKNLFCKSVTDFGRIFTANMDECFASNDAFALGGCENMILHVGDEMNGAIAKTGRFRQYIRCTEGLMIQNKYGHPHSLQQHICKIQPLNGSPVIGISVNDKFGANFSRQIFLSFDMDFSIDSDLRNELIQDEFVRDEQVLTYLLRILLEMPFVDNYDLSDVQKLNTVKAEVISDNVPSFDALDELLPRIGQEYLSVRYGYAGFPYDIVYNLYQGWCKKSGATPVASRSFKADLKTYIRQHAGEWEFVEGQKVYRKDEAEGLVGCTMLITEYHSCLNEAWTCVDVPPLDDTFYIPQGEYRNLKRTIEKSQYHLSREFLQNKKWNTGMLYMLEGNPLWKKNEI